MLPSCRELSAVVKKMVVMLSYSTTTSLHLDDSALPASAVLTAGNHARSPGQEGGGGAGEHRERLHGIDGD